MPRKTRRRTKPAAPPLVPLTKLRTIEDQGTQEELKRLQAADPHAREILVGSGPFIGEECGYPRFFDAIDDLSHVTRCDCVKPEREEFAYYIGLAVGLRLARAVDGPVDGRWPMSARTLDTVKPYPGVGNDAWPLLEQADQAAGRYLMHGAGLPDFGSDEGRLLFLEAIPSLCESRADHEKWTTALEAVATKYNLTRDEREAIEGGASCEAAEATFEGYLFGLAVGLRLADARHGGGQ